MDRINPNAPTGTTKGENPPNPPLPKGGGGDLALERHPAMILGSLVTVGDEILSGHIANGNAHYIATQLFLHGFRLTRMITVGDQEAAISRALLDLIGDTHFLICTGGLGPTEDDRTVAAVATALERPLTRNATYDGILRAYLEQRGLPWSAAIEHMARLPEGAEKLGEVVAAGFTLEHWNTPCYFLPGVPAEMRMFMEQHVLPDLCRRFPERPRYRKRILRVQGLPESHIQQLLQDLAPATPEVDIGYLPQTAENWVTLLTAAPTEESAEQRLLQVEERVRLRLGTDTISGRDDETLEIVIGQLLRRRSWKLAVAESCTGGLVAARITTVAGASDYLDRGFITYSNESKVALLGVSSETLAVHGAVSYEVAKAMAEGARLRAHAQVAVAVTGIAGPSGGTPSKPVGTVFVACASESRTVVLQHRFSGDRRQIQEKSAQAALVLLWKELLA
jgi:nicotinamide-nucleotide amidase